MLSSQIIVIAFAIITLILPMYINAHRSRNRRLQYQLAGGILAVCVMATVATPSKGYVEVDTGCVDVATVVADEDMVIYSSIISSRNDGSVTLIENTAANGSVDIYKLVVLNGVCKYYKYHD